MDKKFFNQIRTLILHKGKFSFRIDKMGALYISYKNGECKLLLFHDENVLLFLYQMYHHKNLVKGHVSNESFFSRRFVDGVYKGWKKQDAPILKSLHTSYLKAA